MTRGVAKALRLGDLGLRHFGCGDVEFWALGGKKSHCLGDVDGRQGSQLPGILARWNWCRVIRRNLKEEDGSFRFSKSLLITSLLGGSWVVGKRQHESVLH